MNQETSNASLDSTKYLLHHKQNNRWFVVSSAGLRSEMRTGLYDECKGPYDDAVEHVDKIRNDQNIILERRRQPSPRVRSQDEIMAQVAQVRAKHCGIRM